MLRLSIAPTTFDILPFQKDQNKYIEVVRKVNKKKASEQHKKLEKSFENMIVYTVKSDEIIPDIVFVANGGLCLPRLPEPVIVLPYMKYPQRKKELKYLREIFSSFHTVDFPGSASAPFEGQAEIKWFHGGTLGVCGYGHRSTKESFHKMEKLLKKVYSKYGIQPPKLLVLKLESPTYYHLDVAMLEYDDTKCIVHKRSFSPESIQKLKEVLDVYVLDTTDSFCLNAVVDGKNLITHTLTPDLKKELEHVTGKKIKQVDTSEFEKAGGSVRCMTLDIF